MGLFRDLYFRAFPLESAARYVHAIMAFPIRAVFSILTILLGAKCAPGLLNWLVAMAELSLPNSMESVIVVAVFGALPLLGFWLWWQLVKLLEEKLND